MRDHLEELMEAGAEALWEAHRRLTAALSAAGPAGKPSRPGIPETDPGREGPAADPVWAQMPVSGRTETENGPATSRPAPVWPEEPAALSVAVEGVLEEGGSALPLMAQTAALERAVQSAARQEGMNTGRQSAADSMPGGRRRIVPGAGPWAEIPGPAGGRTAFEGGDIPVEDTDRAERLDRIFRRDSRRYDGGFFLY